MHGINRLYFLPFLILHDAFSNVWKFFSRFFGKTTPASAVAVAVDKTSLAYLEKEYIEMRKRNFLKTYENEDTAFFSQNIESAFYDKSKLCELLRDEHNLLEKGWKTRILIEHTPRGNVFMHYDPYKPAFAYYSDQTTIPYPVINAVAMKYVITYLCRDFFIDNSIVPKEYISRLTPKDEQVKPSKPISSSSSKSPFVKSKMYNDVSGKTDAAQEKITNRFVHLGKVRNYDVLSKSVLKNGNNGFKTSLLPSNKLSYEDYKKMKQSTTVL